jgi:DNA-binding PucR family transcriptional regulator
VALGRGEYRQGRELDALLAAYRVGARVSWRRIVEVGVGAGLEPATLYELGEAIFAYIDELSAASVEGWSEEQAAAAGERDRLRQTLVRLLVQEPQPEESALAAAAERAAWPVPATLAIAVTSMSAAAALPGRLDSEVIAAAGEDVALVVLPDAAAPGRRAALDRALGGETAALGPCVDRRRAAKSRRRAELAWRFAQRSGLSGLVVADDHLAALLLESDRELAVDLAAGMLAPLSGLAPKRRERLSATLTAWLDLNGRVEEVARTLGVHPQTVRYRLGQLRELFGDRLDQPAGRFELQLALHVEPR